MLDLVSFMFIIFQQTSAEMNYKMCTWPTQFTRKVCCVKRYNGAKGSQLWCREQSVGNHKIHIKWGWG